MNCEAEFLHGTLHIASPPPSKATPASSHQSSHTAVQPTPSRQAQPYCRQTGGRHRDPLLHFTCQTTAMASTSTSPTPTSAPIAPQPQSESSDVNSSPTYIQYEASKEEHYLPAIRQLISKDLSEPYSIYVYRYFLYQWGDLCYMVSEPFILNLTSFLAPISQQHTIQHSAYLLPSPGSIFYRNSHSLNLPNSNRHSPPTIKIP